MNSTDNPAIVQDTATALVYPNNGVIHIFSSTNRNHIWKLTGPCGFTSHNSIIVDIFSEWIQPETQRQSDDYIRNSKKREEFHFRFEDFAAAIEIENASYLYGTNEIRHQNYL